MANQIINVVVNSKGAVTVARELNAIGDSAKSTATYLNGLRAVLAAALTFSGAGQIVDTINSFTALQNRLRQVADANNTVSDSWTRLLNIANQSYSAIDSTVDLYFRVAQAYKAWGESANAAYKFTELFQKAAILSGSTMQTTSQAVYQFSQALNKGKLDGDEFRSVLEGLPYVANLIQKSLGVTRSELYQLSKEGKISVDRIKEAFEGAAKTIQKDWSNITPTIGMAMQVLSNNWTDFVGKIETSTGVFSGIAQLIILIANNFTLLAIALAPVAISLGFLAGRLGIGLVVTGFRDLTTAIKEVTIVQWLFNAAVSANPYVLAAVAIAAVVTGIIYFRNELGLTSEAFNSLWNVSASVLSDIVGYLTPLYNALQPIVSAFLEWNIVFVAIRALANVTMTDIVSMFSAIGTAVASTAQYMIKTLGPVFTDLMGLAKSLYDLIKTIVDIHVKAWGPAVITVWNAMKSMWEYVEPTFTKFVKFLKDVYDRWKIIGTWLKSNFKPILQDVFEGWIIIIREVISWINSLITLLKRALALMSAVGAGGGGGGGGGGAHYGAQFNAGEGFANGGSFGVGGTGVGRDTTPVAFRAERGERVTVETKKQQRANDNQGETKVNVPVNVTSIFDLSSIPLVNESATGQRSIINVVRANREEINAILGAN